jgi:hypothetical protein
MKKPKKPPVKTKGGAGAGSGTPGSGKRGVGPGKARGWKVHHKGIVPHHPVAHRAPAPKKVVPHHPVKTPKKPKKRQWSPGADVACCTAEALGMLLGWTAEEILNTYWATASDPDAGASIAVTLEVAGIRQGIAESNGGLILGVTLPEPHAIAVTLDGTWWSWGEPFSPGDWPDLVIEEAWQLCAG